MTAGRPPDDDPSASLTPPSDPSTWRLPRLRIDVDGTWYHEEAEVTHEGILESLRDGLRIDDEGYHLRIGPVRVPVVVDDCPHAVVRVEAGGAGFRVVLSDGTREPLALETLRLGPGEIPYCRVKGGRFPARFSRAAAWTLLQQVEEPPGAPAPVLRLSDGRRHPIPRQPRPLR